MELVGTLTSPSDLADLPSLTSSADWLEVRADLVSQVDVDELRERLDCRLLFTLRSEQEGGEYIGSLETRHELLIAAASSFDAVDLEAERDLVPSVLDRVPPGGRIISWHGPPASVGALRERLVSMRRVPAWMYKLVPAAVNIGDGFAPLEFLAQEEGDLVSFASGEAGGWTRPISCSLGSCLAYGSLMGRPGAPGQPSLSSLTDNYGLPTQPEAGSLYGIVGSPVGNSLSPRLHNAAYRALGLDQLFVPFEPQTLGEFWREVVQSTRLEDLGLPLRGLAITAPFKATALGLADVVDPVAIRSGGGNTMIRSEDGWRLTSTDADGVLLPLGRRGIDPRGRRVFIAGAGGAGRATAVGFQAAGADVTLFNRTPERGERAAGEIGVPFRRLSELDPAQSEIVVIALASREGAQLPFDIRRMRPGAVVIDLVYGAGRAELVDTVPAGVFYVDGREVLLFQALRQFELMTGRELPAELGFRVLGLEPPNEGEVA